MAVLNQNKLGNLGSLLDDDLLQFSPEERAESFRGSIKGIKSGLEVVVLQTIKSIPTWIKAISEGGLSGVFPQILPTTGVLGEVDAVNKRLVKEITKPLDPLSQKIAEVIFNPITELSQKAIDILDERQKKVANEIFNDKPGLDSIEEYMFTITAGGTSFLSGLGVLAITKSPTAAATFLSLVESSDTYNEARLAGKEPGEAFKIAGRGALGTFFLEKLGLDFFINKGIIPNRVVQSLAVGAVETTQELLQTFWQNINDKIGFDKSKDIFEGWFETIMGTAPVSIVAGFFVPGFSVAIPRSLIEEIQKEGNVSREEAERIAGDMVELAQGFVQQTTKDLTEMNERQKSRPFFRIRGLEIQEVRDLNNEEARKVAFDSIPEEVTDINPDTLRDNIVNELVKRGFEERGATVIVEQKIIKGLKEVMDSEETIGGKIQAIVELIENNLVGNLPLATALTTKRPLTRRELTLKNGEIPLGTEVELGLEEPIPALTSFKREISAEKRGVTEFQQEKRILERLDRELAKELAKPKGLRRRDISFLKMIGEFNQKIINEIKQELKIKKPIKKMELEELNQIVQKLKERLTFKEARGFEPKIKGRETPAPEITENIYSANRKITETNKKTLIKSLKETAEKIVETADVFAGVISTRLANISSILKAKLRVFEFDLRKNVRIRKEKAEPFLKKIKEMSDEDYSDWDLAAKNGDIKKQQELYKKYGMEKEAEDYREVEDELHREANSVGFEVGYLPNHFHRSIKDSAGLLNHLSQRSDWGIISEAIKAREMALGRDLNVEERAQIANTMIRGFKLSQITLSKTGAMKERIIDFIDPELNQFYEHTANSALNYIESVTEAIEARKFFGKELKINEKTGEQYADINNSIGAFVTDLMAKGEITVEQEIELKNMLSARFNQKKPGTFIRITKDLIYLDTLGNVANAITQIGDLGLSLYAVGPKKAIPEILKSFFGKSKIKKEDIEFATEEIAAEVSEQSSLKRLIKFVFQTIGFTKIDRLGLETLANGSIRNLQEQAKSNDSKVRTNLRNQLNDIFPEQIFGEGIVTKVMQELESGEITDNVKFLAFNIVLDFSPRALSEMPERYLNSGNGRIFYILKTWQIKLLDIYRRESWNEIKAGRVSKGLANLFRLSIFLTAMNATADVIKDLLLGREIKLNDLVVNNIIKLSGVFSRYTIDEIGREGLASSVLGQIVPPIPAVDDATKDLVDLYKDFDKSLDINELRSVKNIPIGGDLYYWWFGKGREVKEKDKSGLDLDLNLEDLDLNLDLDLEL